MSILEHRDMVCGRASVYYTTDGSAPSTGGGFQVGDFIVNISGTGPSIYQCVTAGPSPAWVVLLNGSTVRSPGGAATVTTSDRYLVVGASAAVTIPAATSVPIGRLYTIMTGGNFTPTVTPVSGNINGRSAYTMTAYGGVTLLSDGSNYYSTNAS